MVSLSDIDIGATPLHFQGITMEAVDFIYPFNINDFTFVAFRPEYKPHICGIFQTFLLHVWITLASTFFGMTLIYHFILKYKCNIGNFFVNVFAILMRQSAIIIPSFAENLLYYSWVIGAMILCLSNDSVFLSFLSVPPLTKIMHLSDLATAIQKEDYKWIALKSTGVVNYLRSTEQEHLGIITDDITKNRFRFNFLFDNFARSNKTTEIVFFAQTDILDIFSGKFFSLEDKFFTNDWFNVRPTGLLLHGTARHIRAQNDGFRYLLQVFERL